MIILPWVISFLLFAMVVISGSYGYLRTQYELLNVACTYSSERITFLLKAAQWQHLHSHDRKQLPSYKALLNLFPGQDVYYTALVKESLNAIYGHPEIVDVLLQNDLKTPVGTSRLSYYFDRLNCDEATYQIIAEMGQGLPGKTPPLSKNFFCQQRITGINEEDLSSELSAVLTKHRAEAQYQELLKMGSQTAPNLIQPVLHGKIARIPVTLKNTP